MTFEKYLYYHGLQAKQVVVYSKEDMAAYDGLYYASCIAIPLDENNVFLSRFRAFKVIKHTERADELFVVLNAPRWRIRAIVDSSNLGCGGVQIGRAANCNQRR